MKLNYQNLKQTLINSNQEVVRYTFEEIETIIGGSIPNIYLSSKSISHASSRFRIYAEQAGYRIGNVDYMNLTITFVRGLEVEVPDVITYNSDLPESVTKTNGVVDINVDYFIGIKNFIWSGKRCWY